MEKRISTDYGLEAIITDEKPKVDFHYENTILEIQLNNFGFYILDEYRKPIDNEFDLQEILSLYNKKD